MANGCFDLIHIGHVRYLQEAKKRGDILVLALNSNSSVCKLKGKGRPILKEKERVEIMTAFSCIDYVTVFSETNVEHILKTLKPDYHAKGTDYTVNTVPERETVRKYGGHIAITGGPKVRNTTDIIADIAAKTENNDKRSRT